MRINNFLRRNRKLKENVKANFKLHKYKSDLYIKCGNLLIKNGFQQTGEYVFTRKTKKYSTRAFCLYHFYTDGLTLNIYYPQEHSRLIKSVDEMQEQIDRFKNE